MTALEIVLPAGQVERVIVRCPGDAAFQENPQAAVDEYHLLEFLHAQGLPVPAVRLCDLARDLLPAPYLVMEWIDGQPDFSQPFAEGLLFQMAGALSRIHQVGGAPVDLSFLSGRNAGRFAQTLNCPPVVLNESFSEGRIRTVLQYASPSNPHPGKLLHGDYWPGNILWHKGNLAAVVDWEDAALGDPLVDLSIARLDLLWIFGRRVMETFTAMYLSLTGIDAADLAYWDLNSALRLVRLAGADLARWAEFFIPYGRADITPASIQQDYDFFINQAFNHLPAGK